MIQATFKKRSDGYHQVELQGHANFAPHGNDILCAGVSVLYITTFNELEHEPKILSEPDVEMFIVKPSIKNDILVEMLLHGIQYVAEKYPDYVRVTELRS